MKKSNGSITLYVLIAMLFFIMLVVSIYIAATNASVTQQQAVDRTKEIYSKGVNEIDNVYASLGAYGYNEYGNYSYEKGINKPILTQGMVAVKWNSLGYWEIVDNPIEDTSWYEYNNNEWANVMLKDGLTFDANGKVLTPGSMFVWIPRYAYKIETAKWHTNQAGIIDIKFLPDIKNTPADGTDTVSVNNVYKANETGTYVTELGKTGTVTNKAVQVSSKEYVVHPSFRFGDTELPGIWVAKFEAGYEPSATAVNSTVKYTGTTVANYYGTVTSGSTLIKYPVFKPNTYSYNNINATSAFNISKHLGDEGNPYDLSEDAYSHLMKNIEWGAVSYLSQSKYGRNGVKITLNDTNKNNSPSTIYAVTGGDNYISKVNQSTTGNVTGIYDMAGGAYEIVAAYVGNSSATSSANLATMSGESDYKYKDVYIPASSESAANNYLLANQRYGDAVFETSSTATGSTTWFTSASAFVTGTNFLNTRGGYYGTTASTIFTFQSNAGAAATTTSFRVVLVPSKSTIAPTTYIANEEGSNVINIPTSFVKGDKLIFNTTGTRNTGSLIRFKLPQNATIQIEAYGAEGSEGNMASQPIRPAAGKGAYIKTDSFTVNQNDEFIILVGQKGDLNPSQYAGDGSGGGRRWRYFCM